MSISLLAQDELSFRQWQVWAVLLLASACGYFSLSVHYLHQDRGEVAQVVSALEGLAASEAVDPSKDWLIGVHQVLPTVRLHVGASTLEFTHALERLPLERDGVCVRGVRQHGG